LTIPILNNYNFVDWLRIAGGVSSYIAKILPRFEGEIIVNAEVTSIARKFDRIEIKLLNGATKKFDKVIFPTPRDRVIKIRFNPTEEGIRWFSPWQANSAITIVHTDTSLYHRYGIEEFSEFDFFQGKHRWGYNAYLNQICGIAAPPKYSLAFNLDCEIDSKQKKHETPL